MYYSDMANLDTFQDVISAFGGPTKYAAAIGIPGFHAQSMKNRDSIPPAYWADTVAAAARLEIADISLGNLAIIAKRKRPHLELES